MGSRRAAARLVQAIISSFAGTGKQAVPSVAQAVARPARLDEGPHLQTDDIARQQHRPDSRPASAGLTGDLAIHRLGRASLAKGAKLDSPVSGRGAEVRAWRQWLAAVRPQRLGVTLGTGAGFGRGGRPFSRFAGRLAGAVRNRPRQDQRLRAVGGRHQSVELLQRFLGRTEPAAAARLTIGITEQPILASPRRHYKGRAIDEQGAGSPWSAARLAAISAPAAWSPFWNSSSPSVVCASR